MVIDPAYQEALDYIYSYVDYSLTRSFRYSPEKFDLGRMRDLMASLGNPERAYPSIHIAGTKGKGSVAAMCSSALRANGYKVGLYTSPHLIDFTERIQVDGEHIAQGDLVAVLEEIKEKIEAVPAITTFEITTALAFYYFQKQGIDVGVFEVGLGGRLDATNVITPEVTVITSLSYDHTDILGSTLTAIAGEKAGIIKPNVPVVMAPQEDEAAAVIAEIATSKSAPLVILEQDYGFKLEQKSTAGQSLSIWRREQKESQRDSTGGEDIPEAEVTHRLTIPLLGYHQVQNAATAYVALQVFKVRGFALNEDKVAGGFRRVFWPGRFEILQRDPPLVIDSAHNRDSARKLRRTLDDYFPREKVILIIGASEDKDIAGMFAELAGRVDQVIATRSYHPRSMDVEEIVEVVKGYNKPAKIVLEVPEALDEALEMAATGSLILAGGSLFIAAGVREAWMACQEKEKAGRIEENS